MPATPSSPHLCVFADGQAVVEALASHLVNEMKRITELRGSCRLALAGGSTPRRLYRRLAEEDLARRIPWDRLQLFWGDERCVAADHPASNYRMAREAWLDTAPIPPSNVHPINGSLDASTSAKRYAEELGDEPLDIVLLGMGTDGHTASLFPGRPEARVEDQSVVAAVGPTEPTERVSLSLGTLNSAGQALFLIVGEDKGAALAAVLEEWSGPSESALLPSARIHPENGSVLWFVDRAALGGPGRPSLPHHPGSSHSR